MTSVENDEREEPRRVSVTIGLRALLVVVAVVLAVLAFSSISDALLLVFVGVFLAFVLEFPVRLLMRKTRLGRGMAATLMVFGSIVVVTLLAFLLLAPLLRGIRDLLKDLPEIVARLRESDELSWLGDSSAAGSVEDGARHVSDAIPNAAGALIGAAGHFFSFALGIFTVTFVCLFLLVDMENIKKAVSSVLMPSQSSITLDVWERVTETISRWAIGAATIAVIAGVVQGGAAWILGSSYWVALMVVAGFLDLIPNLGATIAGFILVPTLLAEKGLTAALIMLAVVLVYQQIENSLLTPTIQGKAVDIWPVLVITSVTIFGALLGVLGALVAVPLTGSIQILVAQVTRARRERVAAAQAALEQTAPEDGTAAST